MRYGWRTGHPDPQGGHSHIVVQPIPAVRGRDGRGGPIVLVGVGGPVGGRGGAGGTPASSREELVNSSIN